MSRILTQKDIDKLTDRQRVQVAVYAAELVADLVEAKYRPLVDECIETTKKWLKYEDETTAEECRHLSYAIDFDGSYVKIKNIAWAAGWAAWTVYHNNSYNTAETLGHAINASPNQQETIDKIYIYYDNLLNVDKHIEEAFLGE